MVKSHRVYKGVVSPTKWISGIIICQFSFWLIAFPNSPTVVDGEPRETDVVALTTLLILFLSVLSGLILGSKLGVRNFKAPSISRRSAVKVAIFLHIFAAAASITQLYPILSNPGRILLILESSGINRQAAELRDAAFGIPTLVTLWVPALSLYIAALRVRFTRGLAILSFILFLNVALYGVLMMSRTHIITAILLLLGASVIYRPELITRRKMIFFGCFVFFIVWSNSLIRTGILVSNESGDSLFSFEVQYVLFQEFVEKYFGGEFNNSLIIMTYQADPLANYSYGTMFASFSSPYKPDRFLNTMNILGYFYWQFGIFFAPFLLGFLGCFLGVIAKLGWRSSTHGVSYFSLLYIVSFPGFLHMSRINYFFLPYFLMPFLVFSGVFFLKGMISKRRLVRNSAYHRLSHIPSSE